MTNNLTIDMIWNAASAAQRDGMPIKKFLLELRQAWQHEANARKKTDLAELDKAIEAVK